MKYAKGIQEAILQKNRRIEGARQGVILSVISNRYTVGSDRLRNESGRIKGRNKA